MSNGLLSKKLRATAARSTFSKPGYVQVRCKSTRKFLVPDSFQPHLKAKENRWAPSKGETYNDRWQSSRQSTKDQADADPNQRTLTSLDNAVEAGIWEAAAKELGMPTEPTLQAFCGQTHHPHISSYLRGYVRTQSMNIHALALYWAAILNYLPDDVLTRSRIISQRNRMKHRSYTYAASQPTEGFDGIVASANYSNLGWHMFLFTSAIYGQNLLFDGTEKKFLPGPATVWRHRLWAGGSINLYRMFQQRLSWTQTHHMVESPVDLRIVGANQTPEKVFLTISKRFVIIEGKVDPADYTVPGVLSELKKGPAYNRNGVQVRGPWLEEKYTLCFLREPPNLSAPGAVSRVIAPPSQPKFSHTLTPDRHLLFCWSSLSYNAHLIHLDTAFAQKEYGAKDLIVHGPLTLILILEWFQRTITKYAIERQLPRFHLRSIDYKNLTPLYVDEPMTLCAKPTKFQTPGTLAESWEVWVQKDLGEGLTTMAFKGTIKLIVEQDPAQKKRGFKTVMKLQSDSSDAPPHEDDEDGEFKSPFF